MPWFDYLTIRDLDLSREHKSIHRMVTSSSVTMLELRTCKTRSTAQLGRFITSFPSLSSLCLRSWTLCPSGLQDTGIRCSGSKSSIRRMVLNPVQNMSGLLDYFLKARPFVTNLNELILQWEYTESIDQNTSLLQGLNELFHHCSQNLEKLTITVDNSASSHILAESIKLCG